jgi:hypothetical protein
MNSVLEKSLKCAYLTCLALAEAVVVEGPVEYNGLHEV